MDERRRPQDRAERPSSGPRGADGHGTDFGSNLSAGLFAEDSAPDTVVPQAADPVGGAPSPAHDRRDRDDNPTRADRHRPDREPRAAWSNREPRATWSNRTEPARVPESGSRRRAEDIGETWPDLPDWATPDALDADARRDLRGLSKENAAWVAAHLVAAGTFADEDPETAWAHARAARARGGRIAVVRETVGLVAYRAGEWAEAIGELRAARRMGGGPGHLAVLADCERALGHPEKAIELARSEQAGELDDDGRIELATVVAGARADLGQIEAGLAHLEQFDVEQRSRHPRLAYAYADLLDRAGRQPEALTWFIRAANADTDEDTDALERVESLAAAVEADAVDGPEGTTDTSAGARPPDAEDADPDAPVDNDVTHDDDVTDDDVTDDDHAGGAPAGGNAVDERADAVFEEPATDLSQVLFSDDPQAGDR